MFEESMVESVAVSVPATQRWTMAASLIFQIAIAFALAILPLLHPERLSFHAITPLVFTPPPPRPPVMVKQSPAAAEISSTPEIPLAATRATVPIFSGHSQMTAEDAPQLANPSLSMGNGVPSFLTESASHGPSVSSAPVQTQAKPVRVSALSAGMLLTPIRPIYPEIARAARVSGQVIVEAVISKTGAIESLQAISGPPLLREAALDAIRAARYRPFLLNNQPVEVQTTITVNFSLGQ